MVAGCPSVYRHFQGLQSPDSLECVSPHFVLETCSAIVQALSTIRHPPGGWRDPRTGGPSIPPTTARLMAQAKPPRLALACRFCRSFACPGGQVSTYLHPTSFNEEAGMYPGRYLISR